MAVKETVQHIYNSVFMPNVRKVQKIRRVQELVIVTLVMISAVGGFYIYRIWQTGNERVAQKAFSECLQEYQRAFEGSDQAWTEVAMICDLAYKRYSSTTVGPFFLGLRADALIMDGKKEQALQVMNHMLSQMGVHNPLLNLYKTKRALIKLDSTLSSLQEEGRQELQTLAHDSRNMYADQAYYYLGYDAWAHGDMHQAESIWKELIEAFKSSNPKAQSVWATLAEQKLQQNI